MRGISMLVQASGWVQLSAMALIVWVLGQHLWPLLLVPLPFFLIAIIVALKEIKQAQKEAAEEQ